MVLTGLAAFFVLLRVNVTHLGVGLGSLILLMFYVLGMRIVFRQEDMQRRRREQEALAGGAAEKRDTGTTRRDELRRAVIGFSAGALTLLAAAPFLAWSAERIAEATGVTETFIGTSLVAITTSLPELVVSIAAVRLGAFDLAVGNLLAAMLSIWRPSSLPMWPIAAVRCSAR
jgi:cation:H+ antiporter